MKIKSKKLKEKEALVEEANYDSGRAKFEETIQSDLLDLLKKIKHFSTDFDGDSESCYLNFPKYTYVNTINI